MTQHNDNDWCNHCGKYTMLPINGAMDRMCEECGSEEDEYCPNGCDPDTPSCPDCYPHDIDLMRDIARENELMEQGDK